jgi:O-antigen/teichoic acid export membrane protein
MTQVTAPRSGHLQAAQPMAEAGPRAAKPPRNLKEKLMHGGLWALGGKLFSIFCAFISNLVLARALPPADYGAYFIVVNTMIIMATVSTVGMDQVVVRFVAKFASGGDTRNARAVIVRCLSVVAAMTLLVCLVAWPVLPWAFTHVVGMPVLATLTLPIMVWLFFSTLQRQLAETFRGLNDIRCATLFGGLRNNGIVISLVTCVCVTALWAAGLLDIRVAVAISAFGSLFVVAVAAWTLRRRLRNAAAVPAPASRDGTWSLASTLHEGWPLWLATLIMVTRVQGTSWLAGIFDTPEHVALFGVALRFVNLLTAPLIIINALLPPVIAELHARGELQRLQRVIQGVGGIASLPCLAILALFVVLGHRIIGMLFGPYYEAAYPLLLLLCLGQTANIMSGSWQITLPMTGHRTQMLRISAATAVIQLACCVLGGWLHGVLGVAIGFAAGIIVNNAIGMLVVRRVVGIWTFVSIRADVMRQMVGMLRSRLAVAK